MVEGVNAIPVNRDYGPGDLVWYWAGPLVRRIGSGPILLVHRYMYDGPRASGVLPFPCWWVLLPTGEIESMTEYSLSTQTRPVPLEES